MTERHTSALRNATESLRHLASLAEAIEQLLPNSTDCDNARTTARAALLVAYHGLDLAHVDGPAAGVNAQPADATASLAHAHAPSPRAIKAGFQEIATLALQLLQRLEATEDADLTTELAVAKIGFIADRFTGWTVRGAESWMLAPVTRETSTDAEGVRHE